MTTAAQNDPERDSGGTHPWGEPVYLPCDCKDAEIGRRWREDSSFEKWFPITAERLAALEAENAALKREAHEWWTAARDATKAETERCALVAALHSQYPVTTDYDRGYAKARADAAAAIRRGD